MAIYSLSISNVSRAGGSSTLATLSYITSSRVRDERLGEVFYGFGRRERVEATGTLLPPGAPTEWRDPVKLFNALETYEKASNARCGKKMIIALAREWSVETSERVLVEYIKQEINQRGYAATYAIHTDAQGNNPHAHVLIANRVVKSNGQWGVKQKKIYVVDENGERVPLIDKATGEQKTDKRGRKQWKRRTVESHPLDEKEVLKDLRRAWAQVANEYLDEPDWIDHRSLKEQGIDRLPTIHLGYAAHEMERRGESSERAHLARQLVEANEELASIKTEASRLAVVAEQIKHSIAKCAVVLRSAIDQVLSDEQLYKVADFVERLKQVGISVKEHAKDWIYRVERGPATGGEASGVELGERYCKAAIESRLKDQGRELARHYDRQRLSSLRTQVETIEAGGLDKKSMARLGELDGQVRSVLRPVLQAQQAANNVGVFKRGKARTHAQQRARQAAAELSRIAPWWSGQVTPESAHTIAESIYAQAEQIMKNQAREKLGEINSEIEDQTLYQAAAEHIQTLQRHELYKAIGVFGNLKFTAPSSSSSQPFHPPQINQPKRGRSL